jgi:phospholipid/cholesterol/gamma-HCH transport system permease protein
MNSTLALLGSQLGSWLRRTWAAILLTGRVIYFLFNRKPDWRITLEQMMEAGPASLLIALVTALVIGMIFTIQVAREVRGVSSGAF